MFIQIFSALSQFLLLSQAVDSESSKPEAITWTVFFAVIHIFSGYIVYTDNEYEAMFAQHTFMSGVVLPVILGSVLRLMVVAIWAKKSAISNPTPIPQVKKTPDDAYTLEATVQKLEVYLEQIKQQKEQLEANLGQNIKPILTSIESKLAHLQKRIDQEKTKNESALERLKFIPSEKDIVTENLHALHQLRIERNSFTRNFQIEKPHLLAKSVRQQASDSFRQTQKVVKRPRKSVSGVPISQRLSKIEEGIKTLQDALIAFKQAGKYSDDISQFVEVTPHTINRLNKTIEDCIQDVKVTCHPTTAKARTRQLNELGEQVRQFAFDFEGFAKNLSFTTVLEVAQVILPHQQVHRAPKLEKQAQELWQEYHPESDEVFWELYNELLAKVKTL